MARREEEEDADADAGRWRGKSVARRFVAPDGFVILVGKTASDNAWRRHTLVTYIN